MRNYDISSSEKMWNYAMRSSEKMLIKNSEMYIIYISG